MRTGPDITRNGLVFQFDLTDGKSFAGEPTINYIHHQNPRIDASYTPYMPESATGNIAVNHPQAIRVYNIDNNDISYYLNTGISVANSGVAWENARHAYWIYDNDLKKPVVQMYDAIGTWQAKYLGPNMSAWNTYGMTVGSQYTISWLQWTTSTSKYANVGLYTQDSSSSNNFWDGLSSGSATSINTRTHTWERVYQTYTVSGSRDLNNASATVYFYNGGASSNYLRIADVQLELKDHPTAFSPVLERTATQGLIDRMGNLSDIDISNASFTSLGKMTFDGSNDYVLTDPVLSAGQQRYTIEAVFKTNATATQVVWEQNSSSLTNSTRACMILLSSGYGGFNGQSNDYHSVVPYSTGVWNHWIITVDTTLSTNPIKIYVNGSLYSQGNSTGTAASLSVGGYKSAVGYKVSAPSEYFNGEIDIVRIYNRVLTADEARSNNLAIKGKYNL
jgi:hypothetical protein